MYMGVLLCVCVVGPCTVCQVYGGLGDVHTFLDVDMGRRAEACIYASVLHAFSVCRLIILFTGSFIHSSIKIS